MRGLDGARHGAPSRECAESRRTADGLSFARGERAGREVFLTLPKDSHWV
jgi:hypothetical protein